MVGTWQRLAHASLSSAGDTINTGDFTPKDNLKIVANLPSDGVLDNCKLFVGTGGSIDTGSNYAFRHSTDGAGDGTNGSISGYYFTVTTLDAGVMLTAEIINKSGKEKLIQSHTVLAATGAGTAPQRTEVIGKWVNTSGQINTIRLTNGGSGDFEAGSYITVWGASGDVVSDEKTTLADATGTQNVTKTDDLSTDKGWTSNSSDFTYNATNDSVDLATLRRSTTSQEIYIDLQDSDYLGAGNNLSDSSFTVRFGKIRWNTIPSGGGVTANIMLSKGLQDSGTNQYTVNLQQILNSSEAITRARANSNTNNEGNSTHVQSFSSTYTPNTSNIYRWEIVRDGNDFAFKVYAENDSSYSTPLETKTVTATGITDLRYILITNDSEQSNSNTADMEILGDIEVINQQTVSTAPPAGTRYEETDTRKLYRFKASTLVDSTYTEDMSDASSGWTFADTGAVNVTGGSLSYALNRNGSNDAASYDFGSTISDTKFILRFSRTPTNHSHSSGSNCIGFFGLSDNTSGQGTSQDFIGFNFASNDNDGCTTKNGTTLVANSVGNHNDKHTSGIKYYEIKRNSATEVVFTVYNNSDFTGVYWTKTEDSLSSSITSLRYFKWANWHSSGSGSCNVTGTIDDLELWDNVTSAGEPAKWVERGTA